MLVLLDWFFLLFHTSLVLFNMTGWVWRRTRRLHLVTMGLTAASWFLMGYWKGVGYCVCTDWHFQVREALGYKTQADTYIQFLVQKMTGYLPEYGLTRAVSAAAFILAAVLSIALNWRDASRGRNAPTSGSPQTTSESS
jgi:hypothetical protein